MIGYTGKGIEMTTFLRTAAFQCLPNKSIYIANHNGQTLLSPRLIVPPLHPSAPLKINLISIKFEFNVLRAKWLYTAHSWLDYTMTFLNCTQTHTQGCESSRTKRT
jgi:hypothetical protein